METLRRVARGFANQPYLLLPLAAFGWGANTVAGRMAVGEVSPMAIVCLRWLIVVLVLAVTKRGVLAGQGPLLRRHAVYLFAMGAFGYTAFNALFYWAAHYTTAVNMGVIQGTTPGVVIAGTFLLYRAPIGPLQILGLLVTFVGVAVIASRGDVDVLRTVAFNIGDLGILGASLLYAGYTVSLRNRPPLPPLTFFAAMAFAAFVTSLPLVAYEIVAGTVIWPGPRGWMLIVFIALIPSLLSQLLYMRSVELIGPNRAGLFTNLIPVFAAFLGVVVLGEPFAAFQAVALAAVVGGIWLAERGR